LVGGRAVADLLLDEALERALMPLDEHDEVLATTSERALHEIEVAAAVAIRQRRLRAPRPRIQHAHSSRLLDGAAPRKVYEHISRGLDGKTSDFSGSQRVGRAPSGSGRELRAHHLE